MSEAGYSDRHPHEPQIPRACDAEGRCLVCGLLVLIEDGILAFDLTRQYVGEDLLPASEGWSWFDWTEKARAALRFESTLEEGSVSELWWCPNLRHRLGRGRCATVPALGSRSSRSSVADAAAARVAPVRAAGAAGREGGVTRFEEQFAARIRHVAARWIGTPWWNFRFWLGYRIGGFNHARRDY